MKEKSLKNDIMGSILHTMVLCTTLQRHFKQKIDFRNNLFQ